MAFGCAEIARPRDIRSGGEDTASGHLPFREPSVVSVADVPGPMEGIKVVEVGMWVAGPAAAGILGDWGADVIKIEPPVGDPMRGVLSMLGDCGQRQSAIRTRQPKQAQYRARPVRPRGPRDRHRTRRRSRRVRDQRSPGGADPSGLGLRERLIAQRPHRVRDTSLGTAWWMTNAIGPPSISVPSGPGPASRQPWHPRALRCRTSVGAWATTWRPWRRRERSRPRCFARERTGAGQLVSVSLLRVGMYMLGWDINMAIRLGMPTVPHDGQRPTQSDDQRIHGW